VDHFRELSDCRGAVGSSENLRKK